MRKTEYPSPNQNNPLLKISKVRIIQYNNNTNKSERDKGNPEMKQNLKI